MDLYIIEKAVEELLNLLTPRAKSILIARFGLDGNNPKTLEAIGMALGITRERVRQIEVSSFRKLQESEKSEDTLNIIKKITSTIEKQGGFLDIVGLEKELFKEKNKLLQQNQLKIILNSSRDVCYKKGDGNFDDLWYFKQYKQAVNESASIYKKIVAYFKENGQIMQLTALIKKLKNSNNSYIEKEGMSLLDGQYGKNRLATILRAGKLTEANLLNEWGLKSWKLIKPRGARERAYLVFRKHQKPLHFRDLTKLINKHFDLKKPAIPETVCNVIIQFDEFVAIEYGIYALAEWELFDEKIKQEIIYFLKKKIYKKSDNQGDFVKIDEIVKYIARKQQKTIQTHVVQANLFDKNIFSRRGDRYTLKVMQN